MKEFVTSSVFGPTGWGPTLITRESVFSERQNEPMFLSPSAPNAFDMSM